MKKTGSARLFPFVPFGEHRLIDGIGDKGDDVCTLEEDFLDVAGADEGLIAMGHEVDHLDGGIEVFVDFVKLEFGFVVGDGS